MWLLSNYPSWIKIRVISQQYFIFHKSTIQKTFLQKWSFTRSFSSINVTVFVVREPSEKNDFCAKTEGQYIILAFIIWCTRYCSKRSVWPLVVKPRFEEIKTEVFVLSSFRLWEIFGSLRLLCILIPKIAIMKVAWSLHLMVVNILFPKSFIYIARYKPMFCDKIYWKPLMICLKCYKN